MAHRRLSGGGCRLCKRRNCWSHSQWRTSAAGCASVAAGFASATTVTFGKKYPIPPLLFYCACSLAPSRQKRSLQSRRLEGQQRAPGHNQPPIQCTFEHCMRRQLEPMRCPCAGRWRGRREGSPLVFFFFCLAANAGARCQIHFRLRANASSRGLFAMFQHRELLFGLSISVRPCFHVCILCNFLAELVPCEPLARRDRECTTCHSGRHLLGETWHTVHGR
jgi:hypothetical protein